MLNAADTMPYLKGKSARIKGEWESPLHPALRVIVCAAALWHWRATGKPAVLTGLLRTEAEQRAIYPDQPTLRSPHQYGRAADLRTHDLEPGMAARWRDWLNETFPYLGRAGVQTALIHEVNALGEHLHVQVGPAEPRP